MYSFFFSFVKGDFPALIMAYNVTDSADVASKGVANSNLCGIGNSGRIVPGSEISKHGKQASMLHGNTLNCNQWWLCLLNRFKIEKVV